jgi:soluble lytic murein transglycosylase
MSDPDHVQQAPPASPAAAPPHLAPPPAPPAQRGRWPRREWLIGLGLVGVLLLIGVVPVWRALRQPGGPLARVPTPIPTATEVPGPAFFPAPPAQDTPDQPDPPLPAVLAAAYAAEQEGRYAEAANLYRPYTEGAQPPEVIGAARWHLALCRYGAGQYDEAIERWAAFAREHPADPRAVRAAFWAGQAHAAAGRPRAALAELTSYLPRAGAAANGVRLRAADLAVSSAQVSEARGLLNAVLTGDPTRLDRIEAWERLANLDSAAGRPQAALAWLDQIIREAQVPSYRAGVLLRAAQAAADAGDATGARTRLVTLVTAYPDDAAAYQGLHRLLEADAALFTGGTLPYDLACRVAVAAGKYQEALGYCDAFRDTQAPGPERADAAWYTARAYDGLDNWAQAAIWYQAFAEVYPADDRAPPARLGWGAALAAQGLGDAALAQWDALLTTYPDSAAAAEGQFQAGEWLRRAGYPLLAADRWRMAAEAPGATVEDQARARFWQGWALDWGGQVDAAATAWQAAAAVPTFYGFRAAAWLSGDHQPQNPGAAGSTAALEAALAVNPASQEEELLAWVARWPAPPGTLTPASGPGRLATLPEYRRALSLARLGLWSLANDAFDDLDRLLLEAGDGVSLAALLQETRRSAWPWITLRVGRTLQGAAAQAGVPAGLDALPRAVQEGLYPLAWGALVGREAAERNVDPWLVLGLMRQESAYDPRAHSGADAYGLTQVIPDTGQGIAAALGEPNFTVADLYRPAVAVRFGTFYLADTLARFDGNIFQALAGYNAGPGRVPDWATGAAAADPDLFLETIDFPETQHYVRIVWENMQVYRRLYMGVGG